MYCYTYSEVEPWYTAIQVQNAAKVLNSIRFENDFQQWFVPEYQHRHGCKNYTVLSGRAAEYLIDRFADIWNCTSEVVKLPKGRKKFQVIFKPGFPSLNTNKPLYFLSICINLLKKNILLF